MPELAAKNRIAYWDNAKGLLICLVVFGHYLYAYRSNLPVQSVIGVIYSFHMPAFILISGFFSKSDKSSAAGSVIKLAAIYFAFNSVMMVYAAVFENTQMSLITPYYSYWYLLALIVFRLTVRYAEKIRGILLISIITALLIGFWSDISNQLSLARIICFYPFFLVGYRLSEEKVLAFIENRKRLDYLKGTLFLILTLGLAYNFSLSSYATPEVFSMSPYASPEFLVSRIVFISIAILMIISLALVMPSKPIPYLNRWGRNSLAIFVIHRIFTLVFAKIFPPENLTDMYFLYAAIAAAAALFLLGSDRVSRTFNALFDKITNILCTEKEPALSRKRNLSLTAAVSLLVLVMVLPLASAFWGRGDSGNQEVLPAIYPVLSGKQNKSIQNAVKIAFAGDLILLQDQVQKAYSDLTGTYDFTSEFSYAKRYLSEADLAVGVLEGPLAGEESGYSTGNYYDGQRVTLNTPDSFAAAVKNAGFDLLTTANNHLLDKGEAGAMRTLDVLDRTGLAHTGSYRTEAEKSAVQIVEAGGLKIAVLSYTYGVNGSEDSYFLNENTGITSILVDEASPYFAEVKKSVADDFSRVKESRPDVIMVLPHMGTQFSHDTDSFQKTWEDIFIENGAGIILGDHSHAVQPVEFQMASGVDGAQRVAVIVNSSGNFVNSYTEKDGDATAISEVYLDPDTAEVICAAVIPMWTMSRMSGNYMALPIYDIMTDKQLQTQVSINDMKRISEVQSTVTSVMLGAKIPLDQVKERYFIFPKGYVRQPADALVMTKEMTDTGLYKMLSRSKSMCFVGDSITLGSRNGGAGWYEPLTGAFPDTAVIQEAWDGATTVTLLSKSSVISRQKADTYVIAIGTNDVRYRDKSICAMDPQSYTANIDLLVQKIAAANPDAGFVFIGPWPSLNNDPLTKVPAAERDALFSSYGKALQIYCSEKGYLYIDPAPRISAAFLHDDPSDYLADYIHPNAGNGIRLYSKAVMEYGIK